MEDLREYSDDELSLRVHNQEDLYENRHDEEFLEHWINPCFVYTSKQLAELEKDLKDDLEEIKSDHHREYLNG